MYRVVFAVLFVSLVLLSGCVNYGYHPSYIISYEEEQPLQEEMEDLSE